MVHEYKLIEVEEAHSLRDRLDLLDDAYYIDRSVYSPNTGLNNEIGSYHSIGDSSLPKIFVKSYIKLHLKKIYQ